MLFIISRVFPLHLVTTERDVARLIVDALRSGPARNARVAPAGVASPLYSKPKSASPMSTTAAKKQLEAQRTIYKYIVSREGMERRDIPDDESAEKSS